MIPRRRRQSGEFARRSSVASALPAIGAQGEQQQPGLSESLGDLVIQTASRASAT